MDFTVGTSVAVKINIPGLPASERGKIVGMPTNMPIGYHLVRYDNDGLVVPVHQDNFDLAKDEHGFWHYVADAIVTFCAWEFFWSMIAG